MENLTPEGQNVVQTISSRYGISPDSALSMLIAVNNGGGTIAQFSCPELGSGQWMRGGMTMVGDMFNHGLKATVNNLCEELSQALAGRQLFKPAATGGGVGNWWPAHLGSPSISGGQNNVRYAFFPQARRLVVQRDGDVTVFDTMDHNIGGVSQQQGGGTSLTFTSQYGTISTLNLPLVSGPGLQPAPETNFAVAPAPQAWAPPLVSNQPRSSSGQGSNELMTLLEKLGQLRDAGVLTNEEFNAKKTDLLNRL